MDAAPGASVVHIVGHHVVIGGRFQRQLCAWCGVKLTDYDLSMIATSGGTLLSQWPEGELIEVGDGWSSIIKHEDGEDLPANCCASIETAADRQKARRDALKVVT
jgi:hypothetical protein